MNKILNFYFLTSIFFLLTSIYGAYNYFSYIPHWDMWESYLNFFSRENLYSFDAWWNQHNEHRPIISKFLFWIDLNFFNGEIWFLIITNYILVSLICFVFYKFTRDLNLKNIKWLPYFIIIWMFSFIQKENLTWGFQSQFFLAYLFPLTSLFFLSRSTNDNKILNYNFLLSSLFGIFSVFTMANGMLILILNFMYTIIFKMGVRKIFFKFFLAIFLISFYLHDYSSPTHLGLGTLSSLIENPYDAFKYTFTYLGSPFFYFLGKGNFGIFLSNLFGIILLLSFIILVIKIYNLNDYKLKQIICALLIFILFVLGSALMTAGGRLVYGTYQALSSRYTTPALMVWMTLFLISLSLFPKDKINLIKKVKIIFIIIVILMIPRQLKVFENIDHIIFEKKISGLALELRVNDLEQFSFVYHSPEKLMSLTEIPFKKNISFFNNKVYDKVFESINSVFSNFNPEIKICDGQINLIRNIKNEKNFSLVVGNLSLQNAQSEKIYMTDPNGVIKGIVLLTNSHKELTNSYKGMTKMTNNYYFKGYFINKIDDKIYLILNKNNCFFKI